MRQPFSDAFMEELAKAVGLSVEEATRVQSALNRPAFPGSLLMKPKNVLKQHKQAIEQASEALGKAAELLDAIEFEAFEFLGHFAQFGEYGAHFDCWVNPDTGEKSVCFVPEGTGWDMDYSDQPLDLRVLVESMNDVADHLAVGASLRGSAMAVPVNLLRWMMNLEHIWTKGLGRNFTRHFVKTEAVNDSSVFAVRTCRVLEPNITNAQVETAMKSVIADMRSFRRKTRTVSTG